MGNLNNKKILLIICGGIAAYKSLELIRLLRKDGVSIKTILTKSGAEFVTPLSITSLSQSKVYQDLFSIENETEMDHISLSRWADLILIAPATANTISKLANGNSDDLASTVTLASNKKINFSFTPHLTPMFRGILTTIYIDINKNITQDKIYKTLINFYKNDYFIKIMSKNTYLSTNDVINTNYCKISVCKSKYKNKLIILSSIDNLIKGGSGQAIQNMNKKFNFPEKMGLI